MSTRYRTRAEQAWSDDLECHTNLVGQTVVETDDGEPTGVLDAQGYEIFRYAERGKLGFDLG